MKESLAQLMRRRALHVYNRQIEKIPKIVKYWDAHRHIVREWINSGIGRSGQMDQVSGITPWFATLKMGPVDRLDVEVPLFMEQMESMLGLRFIESGIDNMGVVYKYGDKGTPILHVYFTPHDKSGCRLVSEPADPTVIENRKYRVVCE